MGNKNKEFSFLPVYNFGMSGLIPDTQNDKIGLSEQNSATLNDKSDLWSSATEGNRVYFLNC